MESPLNQPDNVSGAPYYQSTRTILYNDGQHYDQTISPTTPAYPDLPESAIDETIPQHHGADLGLHHHFDGSDQLEGLLKVANSVAAQEASTRITNDAMMAQPGASTRQRTNKRKHSLTPTEDQASQAMHRSKRQKHGSLQSPTVAPSLASAPNGGPMAPTTTATAYSEGIEYTEPRPPGIHTSAALFRQPSSPNKKSTRPPISKLFTSLELAPSTFLELQSAAKAYMLDFNHPDRQDCVGNRGKGDSDVVKLRLYNCVRDFLEEEGEEDDNSGQDGDQSMSRNTANRRCRGDVYFGKHVMKEDGGGRKWIWPRDKERVVGLCVPLLRRMVTNERQRRYAVETRSQAKLDGGGVKEKGDEGGGRGMAKETAREVLKASVPAYQVYIQESDTATLARPRIDLRNSAPLTFEAVVDRIRHSLEESGQDPSESLSQSADDARLRAGRVLQQEAQRALAVEQDSSVESSGLGFDVHVQTSTGLKIVTEQEKWAAVVDSVLQCPWFESTVKVIVRRGEVG